MAWHVAVAVLAGLLAWPAQPVLAQGFLQQLFGSGPPPPRLYGYPSARPYAYPSLRSGRSLYVWPSPRPFGPLDRRDDPAPERAATYRTLCVRLCDGYYFPISSAAIGSSFARDADACSASCGTEARLFYHPNGGGDVDSMVDLTGLGYSALPNAFKYRKTLVPDCRCRPQPWSETELQRHRAYAGGTSTPTDIRRSTPQSIRESYNPPTDPPPSADPPAPSETSPTGAPSHDTPWAIERPDPIVRETGPDRWPSSDAGPTRPARSRYTWPGGR